jgi:ribosomal protein S12 methylthiotransferase accessory factor
VDRFTDVFEGALYMGSREKIHEFNFLRYSKGIFPLSKFKNYSTDNPKRDLNFLVNQLKQKGHEIFAVDLTTDEARRSGFKAVRVLIPTLQPLSFIHRARYLGSKRLYQAPINMGYGPRHEENINPMPMPFA